MTVRHLPPIYLKFAQPHNYPSEAPPEYSLECRWLTDRQVSVLASKMDSIWSEQVGCAVLFTWLQFLQQESLFALGIAGCDQTIDLTDIYEAEVEAEVAKMKQKKEEL